MYITFTFLCSQSRVSGLCIEASTTLNFSSTGVLYKAFKLTLLLYC